MVRHLLCIAIAGSLACACGSSSTKNESKDEATDDGGTAAVAAKDAQGTKRLEPLKVALIDNPTPKPTQAKQRFRAKLSVKSKSWRKEGAYPIDMVLRGQLADHGVDVVDADDVAGTVSVSYKAGKYNSYVVEDYYAGTRETLSGSRITIKITIAPTDKTKKKVSFTVKGRTDEYFYAGYGADPHQNALDMLRGDPLYLQIGAITAAVLGSTDARLRVYTAQMAETPAYLTPITDVVNKLGLEPANDTEKAFAAASQRDWKACSELGLACAPAIAAFLSGSAFYYSNDLEQQAALIAAIGAIGAIGGDEAMAALGSMMDTRSSPNGSVHTIAAGDPAVGRAWVSALTATNHPHAMFELTRLSAGFDYDIAQFAKTERAKLVAHLQNRPRAQAKVAVDIRWSPELTKTPNLPAFIDNAIRRANLEPVEPSAPADGYFLVDYREPDPTDEYYPAGAITVIAIELRVGKVFGPLSSPVMLDGDQINVAILQQTAMINAMMTIADCAFAACRIPEALELFLSEDYNASGSVYPLMERSGAKYPVPAYPDY
jgi:VCBS repeat-containing protein